MTSWTTSVKSPSDVRCCRTASQSSAIVGNLPPEARPLVYGCATHCTKRYGRHTHTPGRLDVGGGVGVGGGLGGRGGVDARVGLEGGVRGASMPGGPGSTRQVPRRDGR